MVPKQKPGRSRQDYETPKDFYAEVGRLFGYPTFDLAASYKNAKAAAFYTKNIDALSTLWPKELCWLNPPFKDIQPWVKKCVVSPGTNILVLVPASVGSNWFRDYVFNLARVYFLNPRLSFDGTAPYPKDLMLLHYTDDTRRRTFDSRYQIFNWRGEASKGTIGYGSIGSNRGKQ